MLVVVAHPDDETFGTGSVIAHTAVRGHEVSVCCATRGEAGEDTSGTTSSPSELAATREGELRAAATALGASRVVLLEFADSDMEGPMPPNALSAVPVEAVASAVADVIARLEPDVVVTLDPGSVADHRDHQRIGEATTIAFAQAAKDGARLYYWTLALSVVKRWQQEMKDLGLLPQYVEIDLGRPDAEMTTVLAGEDVLETRWAGVAEHRTQTSPFASVSPEVQRDLLVTSHLVRVVPPWDGGPIETSIFD
jgi:LmbE family N-acetylglucosaminyl deacetylase